MRSPYPEGHLPIGGFEGLVFTGDEPIVEFLKETFKTSIKDIFVAGGIFRRVRQVAMWRLFDKAPADKDLGFAYVWIGGRLALIKFLKEQNI